MPDKEFKKKVTLQDNFKQAEACAKLLKKQLKELGAASLNGLALEGVVIKLVRQLKPKPGCSKTISR